MNFVRFSSRLARRGCSRAVARIAARRRLAVVCSAALAAGLAGTAFAAVPASAAATNGICLDADAQQVYDYGAIGQWDCNPTDAYQQWFAYGYGDSPFGDLWVIQNVGALDVNHAADCLDADAGQVYNGGAIIQWGCNPSHDPYQLWLQEPAANGPGFLYLNYGTLVNDGVSNCLDADGGAVGPGDPVFQWYCNPNDPFQVWTGTSGDFGTQYQNLGASE
jgi:hypothetical protein